jgi:hypothetical protein
LFLSTNRNYFLGEGDLDFFAEGDLDGVLLEYDPE